MGYIVIHRQGKESLLLGGKTNAIRITQAKQHRAILGNDTLDITATTHTALDVAIGDTIEAYGRTYRLNRLPAIKKRGERLYEYTIQLEGVQYDLSRVIYDLTIETTDNELQDLAGESLTANLERFMEVMIANLERVFPHRWFVAGMPNESETKTLSFSSGENCLQALQRLCKEYGLIFHIEQEGDHNNKRFGIVLVSHEEGRTHPLAFAYGRGKGLYSLERANVDTSNIVTRLKVSGAKKNLPKGYRATNLLLPHKRKHDSYIEQEELVNTYGVWENKKVFENIYPTRTGTVSDSDTHDPLSFFDVEMFDLNEANEHGTLYLIAGQSAKVHFQTGQLAGHTFEIAQYNTRQRRFTLKPKQDERGEPFPSEAHPYAIMAGDTYKLLDIRLPNQYVEDAEARLLDEASRYYAQNAHPKVRYALDISSRYLRKAYASQEANTNIFELGDYLPIEDHDLGVSRSIRIKSYTRDLLDPYKYQLTIDDSLTTSTITTRVISQLTELETKTTTQEVAITAQARQSFANIEELKEMVFDPEGNYYTERIKPLSIETRQLAVGAKPNHLILQNVIFEPNHGGREDAIRHTAGTLTHFAIADEPRFWRLEEQESQLKGNEPLYIYAQCPKEGEVALVQYDKAERPLEQGDHYNFLLGVLHSPQRGVRAIALTYGSTMINGRFISTGRIASADGQTYFDLEMGVIAGRLQFRGTDGAYHDISELENDYVKRVIKEGKTEINGGLILSNLLALKDEEGRVRAYLDGNPHNRTAFVAGAEGTNSPEDAQVVINHDGSARFGLMRLEGTTGVIHFKESRDPQSNTLLRIGGGQTNLGTLLNKTRKDIVKRTRNHRLSIDTQGYDAGFVKTTTWRSPEYIEVDEGGFIRAEGLVSLKLERFYSPGNEFNQTEAYAEVRILIAGKLLDRITLRGMLNRQDRSMRIAETRTGLMPGRYPLEVHLSVSTIDHMATPNNATSSAGVWARANLEIGAFMLRSTTKDESIKEVVFSDKGLSIFYGANRFLYLQKEGEPFMTVRGSVDMAGLGVITALTVNAKGVIDRRYGRAVERVTAKAERSVNSITVRHNLGHRNYMAFATSLWAGVVTAVKSQDENELIIHTEDLSGASNHNEAWVNILLIGKA